MTDTIGLLKYRYQCIRKFTEELIQPLSDADAQLQSMADASPAKWHAAHTTWFFETFILSKYCAGYQRYDNCFNYLFNSYYNGIGEQYPRPKRGLISRPSVEEVLTYRHHVDRRVLEFMESGLDIGVQRLIDLGLNHEQQHQELILTDIKHALFQNPLYPPYRDIEQKEQQTQIALEWVPIEKGLYQVGYSGDGFCFDNEAPRHSVYIECFSIGSRPVTNEEYLEFVESGGYRMPEYWLADGWDFINKQNIHYPLYWLQQNNEWYEFTLGGLKLLAPNSPVAHLSFYEATAYANWCGKRLPTEHEWEVASQLSEGESNLLALDWLHPRPSQSAGLSQMIGDIWEWTSSSYSPYPNFKPFAGAAGEYNGKFMSNQYVLRGGSCVTPKDHIRNTYRNFFYPHQAWQYSGIRLADSAA